MPCSSHELTTTKPATEERRINITKKLPKITKAFTTNRNIFPKRENKPKSYFLTSILLISLTLLFTSLPFTSSFISTKTTSSSSSLSLSSNLSKNLTLYIYTKRTTATIIYTKSAKNLQYARKTPDILAEKFLKISAPRE